MMYSHGQLQPPSCAGFRTLSTWLVLMWVALGTTFFPEASPITSCTPPWCTYYTENLLCSENAFLPHNPVFFPILFSNWGDPHSYHLSDDTRSLSRSSSGAPSCPAEGVAPPRVPAGLGQIPVTALGHRLVLELSTRSILPSSTDRVAAQK